MATGRCVKCGAPGYSSPDSATVLSDSTSITGPGLIDDQDATQAGDATPSQPSAARGETGPLSPGHSFGPRYRILRVLGAGGMGVVYQAWDQELGLAVALKTIRPEVMSDPITAADVDRRFKRELLLARQVTHPHVVRIHDLGDVEGIKYLTMPFIEGQTLATLLSQTGKVPVARALQTAREIADGLSAAHAAGVVHRDLKPENVMIDAEGHAIIMDFGISRSLTGTGAGTMMGAVVGTLEYMSPEQAKGETADQRSDIYSLGLILYDLIVGRRRFTVATSPMAEAMGRMQHAPPSVRTLEPAVPEALENIVTRCLEPDPANRYQDLAELLHDLRQLDPDGRGPSTLPSRSLTGVGASWSRPTRLAAIAAVALLVIAPAAALIAILSGNWFGNQGAPIAAREPLSMLIADFDNKVGDPVFEGSLEQALAIAMEGAPFITAYPRAQAQKLAQQQVRSDSRLDESTARLVSLAQGIKLVLVGAIEPKGSGYTLAVSAIDPVNGQRLATSSVFASSKTDVLGRVASVATELRGELGDTTPEGATLTAKETITAASLEAMQAYARGLDLNDAARFAEALKSFELALSKDPGLGRAYAGMGTAYYALGQRREAEIYYGKALKLLDRMSEREKYRTLGLHYLTVSRNYEKAIETFETLVQRYPADRAGHANLAVAYVNVRNFAKAMSEGLAAIEIDPKNIVQRTNYSMYAMYAGDFKAAMEQSNIVLKESPSFEYAILTLARSAAAAGDVQSARRAYSRLSEVGALGAFMAGLGEVDLAMYLGRYREAVRLLRTMAGSTKVSDDSGAVHFIALAEANQALGRRAEAVRAASNAAGLRDANESVLFPAARVLIDAGRTEQVVALARRLENMLQNQTASYARLIDGELALKEERLLTAIDALRDGQKRHDSWYAHFLLGRTYVEAQHFAEALAEFELCLKRKGEATDVFIVDSSTLRYLPPLYYWLARAQEGLGNAGARENYQRYLDLRREADAPDPLAEDARRRLRALGVDGQVSPK